MLTQTPLAEAAEVTLAQRRIAPYARRTPLLRATIDGRPLLLKLDNLQLSGAFKFRGAANAILANRPSRVVTASGGNHGLGVAIASQLLSIPATVYVPESAPEAKTRYIERAGAQLIRYGAAYADAAAQARQQAGEPGTRYIEAFNDLDVVRGQATLAAEIVEDCPEVDTIAVAAGGGGLAAGTTLAGQGRTIVTVEPEHCRSVYDALLTGEPVDSPVDSVAASALGASRIGDIPFAILNANRPHSLIVTDADIIAARQRLWDEFRLVVELAAAAPFAAWLAGAIPGELPCLVVCGGNTTWAPGSNGTD